MRITTTMMNNTARETGIPVGTGSLLNYVNMDGGAALNKALNKSPVNAQNMINKSRYEKINKDSGALYDQMKRLSSKTENNIFDKAKESGDNKELYVAIADMTEKYNDTMKTLKSTDGALNHYYSQMLGLAVKDEAKSLESIGIFIGKDGRLTFDKEKVSVTDPDEIAKIIGTEGKVGEKVSFIAEKIQDNVAANIDSISNQYNAKGNVYGNSKSRYEFKM